MLRAITLAVLIVSISGCAADDRGKLLPYTEVVLTPGMKISATHPHGSIEIHADDDASRIFSGRNWMIQTRLIPRRTRWYGSLGLYDPAPSWKPGGRLLVDEGRQFFESEDQALRFLNVGSQMRKPIFTNQGLVIGYHEEPTPGDRPVRSITIWQIYINGKRPTSMTGADDSAITVTGGEILDFASPNPAEIGYARHLSDEPYRPQ
jgi:hypothetical protein